MTLPPPPVGKGSGERVMSGERKYGGKSGGCDWDMVARMVGIILPVLADS